MIVKNSEASTEKIKNPKIFPKYHLKYENIHTLLILNIDSQKHVYSCLRNTKDWLAAERLLWNSSFYNISFCPECLKRRNNLIMQSQIVSVIKILSKTQDCWVSV